MRRLIAPLRKSLVLRITVALSAFLIIFLFAFAILIFNYFEGEFKQTDSEQQKTLLAVVAGQIDQKLVSYQTVIIDISKQVTPGIVRDRNAARHFLDNRIGSKSLFNAGLHLFALDGRLIAGSSYNPDRHDVGVQLMPSFRKIIKTGQPLITVPFAGGTPAGSPAIGFLAAVRDKNDKIIAVLEGRVNLLEDNFLGEFSRIRTGKTGYLYIYTTDRTYIMHPDKSRILTQTLKPGVNRLFDSAIEGFEGTGRVVNSFGVDTLTTFKHLHNADWIIASNYPVAEAYAPIERVKNYFVFIVLIGAAAMIVVVRLMMKRYSSMMVRFAEHVSRAADELGEKKQFEYESEDEIGVLVRTFNRMVEVEEQKTKELLYASTHDGLTGLYNRAYFDSELSRVSRGRVAPVSIVVADLDGLKRCNDTLGHSVGDEMIRAAAKALSEAFRAEDVVARIGGDEFSVIIPGLDSEAVELAMVRVCALVAASDFKANGFSLCISFGWATAETPALVGEALKQADKLMYHDKQLHNRMRNEGNTKID